VRLAVIAYLGFSAGLLTYLGVRYLLEQRQVRQTDALLKSRADGVRQANARFLRDLMAFQGTPQPRVTVQVFPTPNGSTMGWHVTASCEAEAVEVVCASDIFKVRAA
jgi:hypothetical protein